MKGDEKRDVETGMKAGVKTEAKVPGRWANAERPGSRRLPGLSAELEGLN